MPVGIIILAATLILHSADTLSPSVELTDMIVLPGVNAFTVPSATVATEPTLELHAIADVSASIGDIVTVNFLVSLTVIFISLELNDMLEIVLS